LKSLNRPKAFAFTVIAQVLTLLIFLGLGEGVFRLLNPDYGLRGRNERGFFSAYDADLGWAPKKNFMGIHEKDGFAVPVHQNQFGLRASKNLLMKNPAAKRRIIVLGDSYVWGYGVGDIDIFTALDLSHYGVELINFGVSGYGTDQEYLLYKKMGKDFEVNEVTLVITPYNDFMNNIEGKQYGYKKPYFKIANDQLQLISEHVQPYPLKNIRSWLNENLFAFNYINSLVRNFKQSLESRKKGASAPKQAVLNSGSVTDPDRYSIELTIRIVDDLRNLVESQGRKFSVVFIPYKVHINKNINRNHPMVPLFADKLHEKGIEYLEPFFIFSQPDEKKTSLFNQGDNHFSAAGHALFARALLDPKLVNQTRNYYHKDGAS
jgi:hypothetical protein